MTASGAPLPSSETTARRKAAGIVGLAVIASRLLGLVRELVLAALFGAGKLYDAYLAAFRIPNLLRDLFAEGALSTAFTTVFTRTWEKDGPPPAWVLANLIFSAMLFFLGGITIMGVLDAPLLVQITNPGFHSVPGKFELTVELTRILFPFILFVSLAAAVMGILNARHVFGLPASASSVFNIVSVAGGVLFSYLFEPQADWLHPHFGDRALHGLCLGVLLGGVAQLGVQLPGLWKLGYRFEWRLKLGDPKLKEVWALMWPSVIAGAAVQINVLVNSVFASHIDGGQSWLGYSFRLMQLPIGVFGVSIATATLPSVARHFARGDLAAFGANVRESLRLVWYFTVPSAIGLAMLARPIISVIYERGRFTPHDTEQVALALEAYALGLAGYAAIKVLVPCFYALGEPRTPLRISLIGIGVNLGMNFALIHLFGRNHAELALTTSVVALVNFVQLWVALGRRVDAGTAEEWVPFAAKIGIAAFFCGDTAWAVNHFTASWADGSHGFPLKALSLGVSIGASAGVYLATTHLLHVDESREAIAFVRRKFLKK